jgi:NAD(P)H dehydrogenase (quinone)
MFAITGATGQLGHLVIEQLLRHVPASQIIAAVRSPEKATDLAALGVQVRHADYSQPETLDTALSGASKVLLISSNEIGQRATQHQAVIDAAQRAGVELLAYTSVLHADTSALELAEEHRQTETAMAQSGVPSVILRNGWYNENYAGAIPAAIAHGAHFGCAGDGRFSAAARADYAAAAVAVLTSTAQQAGQVYELAGDDAFTLSEFAAQIAAQSGKPVAYTNLPEADYKAALLQAGLPEGFAQLLANADTAASQGALFDDSGVLSRLIGRATTPMTETIAAALKE